MNSFEGTLFTDQASWSEKTATLLGKQHGICTTHVATGIMTSNADLSGLQVEYMTDMNYFMYDPLTEDEFKDLAQNSLLKYGHNESSRKYIMSLYKVKERVCATFTQFMFRQKGQQM